MKYMRKIIEMEDQPVLTVHTITVVKNLLPHSLRKPVTVLPITWQNWGNSLPGCLLLLITTWI